MIWKPAGLTFVVRLFIVGVIRTTNLLERAFVEQKRRTKTIPGFWTEKNCLPVLAREIGLGNIALVPRMGMADQSKMARGSDE